MAINSQKIQEAFFQKGILGTLDQHMLKRFGVDFTLASVQTQVEREVDFIQFLGTQAQGLGEKVLIDASQWCAHASYGDMMQSPEWQAIIEPDIHSQRDRLEGLLALSNCFGWGKVVDYKLDETARELELSVNHSYYVDYWTGKGVKSNRPTCYMWTGVTGGLMDLLYGSKVNTFTGEEVICAARDGGDKCVFRARQIRKKFGLG